MASQLIHEVRPSSTPKPVRNSPMDHPVFAYGLMEKTAFHQASKRFSHARMPPPCSRAEAPGNRERDVSFALLDE
jgi:hypothetical protein